MDKENGFTEKQAEYLKKDIKDNSVITFIASSFDSNEKNTLFYDKHLKLFEKINITFKESYLIDSRITKEKALTWIF